MDGTARENPSHACNRIVRCQKHDYFYLPEPWSGRIDIAPVLFISSNPSVAHEEYYPTAEWQDTEILDFFRNRFAEPNGQALGFRPLLRNGHRDRMVSFWANARGRAAEALGKKKEDVKPGIDYALTEVVHCKSKGEEGVSEAARVCSDRYLRKVLSLSVAKVFIVLGEKARSLIERDLRPGDVPTQENPYRAQIAGENRLIAFLPHPNAFKRKTLLGVLGKDGLKAIQQELR